MENRRLADEQSALKKNFKLRDPVVDDDPIMRVGIAAIIQAMLDMTTCARAGRGEEAIELFEKHVSDIPLKDVRLPGISGVEAIRIAADK